MAEKLHYQGATMRSRLLASSLLVLAAAACDDVDSLGPDAGVDAMDAGTDGAAAALAPVVAQELPDAPSLTELTAGSGPLGLVVGSGAGTAQGRIAQLASEPDGTIRLRPSVGWQPIGGELLSGDELPFDGWQVTQIADAAAAGRARPTRRGSALR